MFSLLWIGAAALVLLIHDPLEQKIQELGKIPGGTRET